MIKPKVSIGIPAYNEEKNIGKLLDALLKQKQGNYLLSEILIFTDGCTDKTESIVQSYKNSLIKLHKGTRRIGQQARQNQIFSHYSGDILVIIEADTLPYNKESIQELIKPLLEKSSGQIGMVSGVDVGVQPQSFFEKISYTGNEMRRAVFEKFKNGINIYTTGGHSMRAFSKNATKKLRWPKDAPEDAYAYLRLFQLNLKIVRQKNAKAYMRNVANIKDRTKQSAKFVSGKKTLNKYFQEELIYSEYFIPKNLIFRETLLQIIKNPFWTSASIFEVAVNRVLTFRASKINAIFNIYSSSKTLDFN